MRTRAGTVAATAVLAGTGLASIALASVAVTAGCSGGSPGATGTVTGSFVEAGGPANYQFPMPGTISFVSGAGATITLNSDGSGKFGGQLPVGTYTVSGKSSRYESGAGTCSSRRAAQVQTGKTVRVTVVCPLN